MKLSYFPGCSLHGTAKEYGLSTSAVCQRLGLELIEIPDWNCCGASSGHSTNYLLGHALAARNLILAEQQGLDLVVACAACFSRFKKTDIVLKQNTELNKKMEGIIWEAKRLSSRLFTDFFLIASGNTDVFTSYLY